MNNKMWKKYLLPVVAATICVVMVIACVVTATMFSPITEGNFSGNTNIENGTSTDMAGGLPLPSDHNVRVVDPVTQLGVGKVTPNYRPQGLQNPYEIANRDDLLKWLLTPSNGSRDAVLANDIEFNWDINYNLSLLDGSTANDLNYDWYRGGKYNVVSDGKFSILNSGRVLDGKGHTITYSLGKNYTVNAGNSAYEFGDFAQGFIMRELHGKIRNTTFAIPSGVFVYSDSHTEMNISMGMIAGIMESTGSLENVRIDFGATIGRRNSGSNSLTGLRVGVIAGRMKGTLTDCEVNIAGGTTMKTEAPNGTSSAGLIAGEMDGATVTNLAINYVPNGNNVFVDKNDLDKAGLITADAKNTRFKNIIIKNYDFDFAKLGHFAYNISEDSTAEGMYLCNTDNYYNFPVREGKQIKFSRVQKTIDFDFAWDRVERDRMIVVPKLSNTSKIYWGISQKDGTAKDMEGYSYPNLYRYMLPVNTMLSIPSATPTEYIQAGSIMNVTTGDVGKIASYTFANSDKVTSVQDPKDSSKMINTALYTGAPHGVTITATSADGVAWSTIDNSNYKVLQNDIAIDARYKGAALTGKYITKVVANSTDETDAKLFSYLDTANRRLILRDDKILLDKCSLTIEEGIANITSKKVGSVDYVDKEWAERVMVTIIVDGLTAMTASEYPNKIRWTFATDAEQKANPNDIQWISTGDLASGSVIYNILTTVHCDDRPVRFALFYGETQLTRISDDSLFSKIDNTAPEISINDKHAEGYLTTLAGYNANELKRMDSYMLSGGAKNDELEMAQIWLNAKAGASGIGIEARGIKIDENNKVLSTTPWGGLAYKPQNVAGDINTNYFAQRMYLEENSREENAAYFNGKWRIQFKAKNGAGKTARLVSSKYIVTDSDTSEEVLEVVVSVDYSAYRIDKESITKVWYGSDQNSNALLSMVDESCTTEVLYPEGRDYFYRNESMRVQVVTPEVVDGYGYSIAEFNKVAVPTADKFLHIGAYNVANSDAIGATPSVEIALKRYVQGAIGTLDSQTYGELPPIVDDNITLPEIKVGESVYNVNYTQTISTTDKTIYPNDNIRIPVGEYIVNVIASISTDDTTQDARLNAMFDLSITGSKYTVTQKEIIVEFDKSTLSSALRNFTQRWVKALDFSTQVVEGDTVAVTSIFPKAELPTEEDVLKGPVTIECYVTVNNGNYIVNSTCVVTLVYFETDFNDPSIYLINTPKDFEAISDNLLGAKFRLNGNIDFESKRTLGITDFHGEFDGNGYSITNAKIIVRTDANKDYNVGLFDSLLPGAVVKNLVLDNFIVDVNASGASSLNVGMLAGYVDGATVTNVMAQGSLYASGIHTNTHGGGLFGKVKNMTLTNAMSVITMTLVQNITATTGGNIVGGGLMGSVENSTISNISAINQGYIHTTVENGAGNIAGTIDERTTFSNVSYLKNALTSAGKVLPQDENAKVYTQFLADEMLYGGVKIREEVRGGNTFADVMTQLIPANMRANGLARLQVKSFKDLIILLNFNFADYQIMNNIHCFNGFEYSGKYMFAGNIINEGGYKVYSDNGVFDIASI